MTVYIGNAVGDEHGKARGGEAGNQSGKELRIQPWYANKKGWRIFRPKSDEVAQKLAYDMRAACNNPNIGYDQGQRNTLYNVAQRFGFDCAEVAAPCECDCSSLVRVCLAYAGIKTTNFNTSSEPSVLLKTGQFVEITEHTDVPYFLRTGDILVTAVKGHTAIVLNSGESGEQTPPEPTIVDKVVKVIGKSVRIRAGYTTLSRTVEIAHRGDTFPFIGVAPSGWYHIMTTYPDAYITNKSRYTEIG